MELLAAILTNHHGSHFSSSIADHFRHILAVPLPYRLLV
jgi:hypothetical protein